MIRQEFTGMLPAAIEKFEELLEAAADLNPRVEKGYDSASGPDSYFYWGAACRITCDDMESLLVEADILGITCLTSAPGALAYTNGLTIDDFKTYRVDGSLTLQPEKEV